MLASWEHDSWVDYQVAGAADAVAEAQWYEGTALGHAEHITENNGPGDYSTHSAGEAAKMAYRARLEWIMAVTRMLLAFEPEESCEPEES